MIQVYIISLEHVHLPVPLLCSTIHYCRFENVCENLIFTNICEFANIEKTLVLHTYFSKLNTPLPIQELANNFEIKIRKIKICKNFKIYSLSENGNST